jgi:alkaline phosphatase D
MPILKPIGRRQLMMGGASCLAAVGAPRISRAADRPALPCGVQSGDISASGGVVWARADRPSRLLIEASTTESFAEIIKSVWVDVLPESDFTGKVLLEDLPADQRIFYRVTPQNLAEPTIRGEAARGVFRTAPTTKRSVRFCWSGDTAGQGWGIDELRGGMKSYETIRRNQPDFFIHNGDNIYADNPILPEQKMPNGEIWKNLVMEEKTKPAETLAEFRASWKYNFLDRNLRAFNAEVPVLTQWDDHEVTDNWWPEEPLTRAAHLQKKYSEKNAMILAARARRAFHEFTPTRMFASEPGRIYRKIPYGPLLDVFLLDMRSYRGPNGENRQTRYGPDAYFLGPDQIAWLKRELKASRATWKVISADMPLSLYVVYDFERKWGSEAVAQADDGAPLGRELEIADLLAFLRREKIRNIVWLTTDVHYTAAHYYDPGKASFQEFDPFWEFVSGPLHAGSFGPNRLDGTFGPQLVFSKAPTPEQGQNLPPSYGLQFFGRIDLDGESEVMTVALKDVADATLWSVELQPIRI